MDPLYVNRSSLGHLCHLCRFTPVCILLAYTRSIPDKNLIKVVKAVEMTVDARSWMHKFKVVSLGRDNPSRNVDANMTIEYSVEGLHHMVLTSSF